MCYLQKTRQKKSSLKKIFLPKKVFLPKTRPQKIKIKNKSKIGFEHDMHKERNEAN